jgi:hypothetical protein
MNVFRRPMFRGGKVDSRGTGITSGLGYAKGGSVEPQATFGVGNNANRDASGREKHAFFLPFLGYNALRTAAMRGIPAALRYGKNLFSRKPPVMSQSKELIPYVEPTMGQTFMRNLGQFGSVPGSSSVLNYIAKNPKKSLGALAAFGLSDYTDMLPSGETIARSLLPGKLERAILGEKEDEKSAAENIQDQADNDAALQALLKELADKEKKKLEADIPTEEDIEINKEKYAELLGKGARGEDISNMLLSFAGKALAPEATVKSAFGEFAAEQAKTPSRKSKVDETAAALAINEYIAGKKSKAELDRFFVEMDYKKSLASRAGKENIAANIAEAGKSNSGYKAVELGLQISFPDAGRPIKIEKGQANDVPLTADNFGKIFIEDEAPYTAVRINIQDGVLFREPIY